MSRHKEPFRFKQVKVSHWRSSMKVGVDAVILGAWAGVDGMDRILDVGCGCGVISLMAAQRNISAVITGIDIDSDSVTECNENFINSPWSSRLKAVHCDFLEYHNDTSFDLIVSNPPYFDSGISDPETARLRARHEGALSPATLLEKGRDLLTPQGRIALVTPADRETTLIREAESIGLSPRRIMRVSGRPEKDVKRIFLEFGQINGESPEISSMSIEKTPGEFTDEYLDLCRDFYLKF